MSDPNPCERFPLACARMQDNEFMTRMQDNGLLNGPGPLVRLQIGFLALVTLVALLVLAGWWLWRRSAPGTALGTALGRGLAAGTVAGLAVVPLGMALTVAGFPVGVYGELVLRWLLGFSFPSALFIEHMLISVGLAVTFVAVATMTRRRWSHRAALGWGALYGAAVWVAVNSLALPLAFGQPTPWQLGLNSIWPSLLVHVVFGAVLGTVTELDARRKDRRADTPAPVAAGS